MTAIFKNFSIAQECPDKIEFARQASMRFNLFFQLRVGNKCHKKIPYFGDIQELKDEQGQANGYYFGVKFADISAESGLIIKGVFFDKDGIISGYHFRCREDEVTLHASRLKFAEDTYKQAVVRFHDGAQTQGKPVYSGLGELGNMRADEWGPSQR